MKYTTCSHCGKSIANCSLQRHLNSHETGNFDKPAYKYATLDHDDLFCKYCQKECKNKNSLIQHEIRCPKNPDKLESSGQYLTNYILTYRKGKTKENCNDIQKQQETMKQKYASGWTRDVTLHQVVHKYKEHNDQELQKWTIFLSTQDIHLPKYETYTCGEYSIVKYCESTRAFNQLIDSASTIMHEHVYKMIVLFGDKFTKGNVVHHIDENKLNNEFENLILFNSETDHKRFHMTDYAYLIYDEVTHKFSCVMKK